LAELYPPTDGAHRSRMPEAIRQAQDDHASTYRPELGPRLLRQAPAHRMPQYRALRSSAGRVPPAYARDMPRGGPDSPQPPRPGRVAEKGRPAAPSAQHPRHQPPGPGQPRRTAAEAPTVRWPW
jgi:hypothetical protein